MDSIGKDEKVCLKLPYISEYVSYETLRYIRRRQLPIHVIFTSGKKLRDIFCSSRPLDRPTCSSISCKICEHLEDNVNCRTTHPVYLITCLLCKNTYCGESSRSLNDRLSEHLRVRYATNPEKPMAIVTGMKQWPYITAPIIQAYHLSCHSGYFILNIIPL